MRKAYLDPILLLLAVHRGGPLIPRVFGHLLLFSPLLRAHLPFFKILNRHFLLQIKNGLQLEVGRDWKKRRGKGKRNFRLGDFL